MEENLSRQNKYSDCRRNILNGKRIKFSEQNTSHEDKNHKIIVYENYNYLLKEIVVRSV